jgi:predicted alpha/beta-hydrolase family hydrolase
LPIEGDRLDLELATVVADGVLVVEVGSDGGQRVVSMVVDADTARAVAVADALSQIRLIQVPEG